MNKWFQASILFTAPVRRLCSSSQSLFGDQEEVKEEKEEEGEEEGKEELTEGDE